MQRSLILAALCCAACTGKTPPRPAAGDAARFLEQASFGPTPESVAHLTAVGYDGWLAEQFAARPSDYDDPKPAEMDLTRVQARFFANAIGAPDQLRQRVAFALSQIFVVSGVKNDDPRLFVPWLRMLSADAFGSWRALLEDVTLSPAMGEYLDMVNNDRPDPLAGTNPNENYGREILQLFSIGLRELNADGTPVLSAGGLPVPTYSQDVVEGFAHVFTGWTYPTAPNARRSFPNDVNYQRPMELFEEHHDTGSKLLLRGVRLPAGQSAQKDLAAALDNIAQHPNVGPFLALRLIQRLVKSNPGEGYVKRVAAVFADNGAHQRGDLKAVVRAVLLDPEARKPAPGAADGKLREPVLLIAGLLRALEANSDGVDLAYFSETMRQRLFYPQTVFNYYPPDYRVPGTLLLGPEFKLRSAPTIVAEENFVNAVANGGLPVGTTVNFGALQPAGPDATKIVDLLEARLLRGSMPVSMRASLTTALNLIPDQPEARLRAGVYLVALSSSFQVQP